MALFLAGITLFCGVHLFTAVAPASRDNLVFKLGENPYKGLYSLLILGGLVMIVFGWKATPPRPVYVPPLGPGVGSVRRTQQGPEHHAAVAVVASDLKRVLRHPQMLGTILWASAHLLTNGDSRSVILFGSLLTWAVLEIVLCNRRDGPRTELPAASGRYDLAAIVIGALAFAALGHFHVKLFGVSPLPI